MLIKDLMSRDVKTLQLDQTVRDTAMLFCKQSIDGAPVVDKMGKLVGLITKSHLYHVITGEIDSNTLIKEIMTEDVITVHGNALPSEVCRLSASRLPVIDNEDRLIGIVTRTDLVAYFQEYSRKVSGELTTILESARNAIIAINNKGIITIFNKAAAGIIGIETKEALGKPVEEILPGTGLPEVIATRKPQVAKKLNIGKTVVISNRSPLIRDNKIIGAVGIFQDVSDFESVSQELKSTRDLIRELDAIIEAVSDGLYITDGQGYTTRINSAYEKISGIKAEEVIGRHMQELVDVGYYSESVTLHVLQERKPVTITHKIKTGIEVMVTGIPVFDDEGNIVRVVTTVRDMETLSRMKQELKESKKLTTRYYNELEQLRLQQLELEDIVVESPPIREIIDLAIRLGQFNSTVLITGESGVGKEIIVKTIHRASQSDKKSGSLIKINCGAIPENLIESELFGYEKGAFTGAKKGGKPGLFELAENGTLFLDEVAELPLNLQVRLLRAIQEREIIRVGGTTPIKIKTRIIAASNKNLKELVMQGEFREDLYYRLNVVPIIVPPLRERREDITPLILHFLRKFNKKFNTSKKISLGLVDLLENYNWPGNVRQLENTVERLVVMVAEDLITLEHLPGEFKGGLLADKNSPIYLGSNMNLRQIVARVEKEVINKAMNSAGTTREIAALLGVSQPTVVRKIKKYNLKTDKKSGD